MTIAVELGVSSAAGVASGPATIDIEELLATRLLVQGNSGSGKSHLLRRLLEQSAPHVQQVIIDPEGDFTSLSDRYGHLVVDANRSEAELEAIAGRIREHRVSCVLNLDQLEVDMQMKAAAVFLNALFDAPRELWYPALVIVDEAQLFAPAAAGEVSDEARKISLGAMTNLMCRGRKRGLAGVIATQRLAKLAKNVAAEASNFLMGRTFLDIDMARAADLLGLDRRQAEMFRELQKGQFVALGPALSRKPLPIRIGSVETHARGSTPKLTPPPVPMGDETRDLILAALPTPAPRVPRRPPPPAQSTDDLLAAVDREAQVEESGDAEVADEASQVDNAAREIALRNILATIMGEADASFKAEGVLYQDFLVHCRIEKVAGPKPDLGAFRKLLPVARAGIDGSASENPDLERGITFATSELPEELQSIYLSLLKAASDGESCPTDADLARVCGSHSSGRARARIQQLEQGAFITVRKDMKGQRIISLRDFGLETKPGNPAGPARAMAGAA